jgi:hypothetical protein
MAADDEMRNPFAVSRIGSCAFGATGKFAPSVTRGNITKMNEWSEEWKSMRGQSSYVCTKEMNQGSFGISGSYGVSGISKLNGSVSGYGGKSSAEGGKLTKVNYQVLVCGGIEYVNFDGLNPSLLLAALETGPRQRLEAALDAYVTLNDSLSNRKLLDVVRDRENHSTEYALFEKWLTEVDDFTEDYGNGMVVAVAWGGVGIVTMEITRKSSEETWKYGGGLEFSYGSKVASATVGLTYDGGQTKDMENVHVHCTSFTSGDCVKELTKQWFDTVNNKSFKDLTDVNVLEKAPSMKEAAMVKNPPEFVKPTPAEDPTKLVAKIAKIKGLASNPDFAQARAYVQAKKTKPDLTLDDFLKEAEKPANAGSSEALGQATASGDTSTVLSNGADISPAAPRASAASVARVSAPTPALRASANEASAPNPFKGYVPIAIWIANWDHLFPWLATGCCNSVTDTETASTLIKHRVMIQDFLALSKLYQIADRCKLRLKEVRDIDFSQIANSFAHACSVLQEKSASEEARKEAFASLSNKAKNIYKIWNANGFLRNCELGLGMISPGRAGERSDSYSPAIKDSKGWRVPAHGRVAGLQAPRKPCDFNGKNYDEFANFYKVLPLILPDGGIFAFGPGEGLLTYDFLQDEQDGKKQQLFLFENDSEVIPPVIVFTPNATDKVLENKEKGIRLYPIPFSAADGVEWKGQSFSTSVGSDVKSRIDKMISDLQKLHAWSFSSDDWKSTWKGTDYYSYKSVRKYFLGLRDEDSFHMV